MGSPPDSEPSGAEARCRESRLEIAIYVAAGLSLILLGIGLRTAILNWIVGPAFVVTFVVLGNRWLGRRKDVRR